MNDQSSRETNFLLSGGENMKDQGKLLQQNDRQDMNRTKIQLQKQDGNNKQKRTKISSENDELLNNRAQEQLYPQHEQNLQKNQATREISNSQRLHSGFFVSGKQASSIQKIDISPPKQNQFPLPFETEGNSYQQSSSDGLILQTSYSQPRKFKEREKSSMVEVITVIGLVVICVIMVIIVIKWRIRKTRQHFGFSSIQMARNCESQRLQDNCIEQISLISQRKQQNKVKAQRNPSFSLQSEESQLRNETSE